MAPRRGRGARSAWMMDIDRVIREALGRRRLRRRHPGLLLSTPKFYGPFREAVSSTLKATTKTYQQDPRTPASPCSGELDIEEARLAW